MAFHDLSRLLNPRHIATFGGASAEAVIRECDRMGFAGEIWPVHPERETMGGRRCFRSIAELPEAPDASFIGVNRYATIDVVRDLSAAGAGGAVCYASGFREVGGEGDALQAGLVKAAGDMPVLGPNCYGVINYMDGALLWPDFHGGARIERGVAIITQSSNIAINLTMNRRGVPIAAVVTLGNQAMVGLTDALLSLARDPRISAIGLHIEGISDAPALAAAVAAAGKPVIAIKTGTSSAGAAMAMTHTASLAGSAAVMEAYFRHIGLAVVDSLPAFLEALKLLHLGGPLRPGGLVSLSCSGGEAALMSDAIERHGLDLHRFSAAAEAAIRETVHSLVTVSNPFDYHTFDWGKRERLAATFAEVMRSGPALTILVLDWPKAELGAAPAWDIAADALVDAAEMTGARAAVLSTLAECMDPAAMTRLAAAGVVPLMGIEESLAAIGAAGPVVRPDILLAGQALKPGAIVSMAELEAKNWLAADGLSVPVSEVCTSPAEALSAVGWIGYPVVAKASGNNLLHKTEVGGVRLGLSDEASLLEAFAQLRPLGDAVLIEAMIGDAIAELIVGVARDPVVGLHLVVGAGGIFAELMQDRVILMLGADRARVREALRQLRIAPLLDGYRGRPAADIEAAVDAIMAISNFAVAYADRLVELDVNPLLLLKDAAVAVDALIRMVEP